MATKIQIRRGTGSVPDLAEGELGFRIDTSEVFIGTSTNENVQILTGEAGVAPEAAEAVKLKTARAITLSGDVTGTANFDGTANITIEATVLDDSHNHIIGNIDNLQASLDLKANLASPTLTGTPLAPTPTDNSNPDRIATTGFVTSAIDTFNTDVTNRLSDKVDILGYKNFSINELSDVTISSPSVGQVLKYTESGWVNGTDNTGEGGAALEVTSGDIISTGIAADKLLVSDGSGNVTWEYITNDIIKSTDVTASKFLMADGDATTSWQSITNSKIDSSGVAPRKVLMASGTDGVTNWEYANPIETVLFTTTTSGAKAVSALTAYDELILELRVVIDSVDGDDNYSYYAYETQRIKRNLMSYTYTSSPPLPGSTTVAYGMKLTSTGAGNGTVCNFRVLPNNSALTSVQLAIFGTTPTNWQLKLIGVKY